ncbi:MAG: 3-dehydroquinate synthase, partial [Phascolarctobacterium sp.]|nr:3-dehydroquinate synthase [Phascolarctobacterium sp.]
MENIHVDLGKHAYDIEIGAGLLPTVGAKVAALVPKAQRAVIVSDSNVAPLYGETLQRSLNEAGLPATIVTIEAGEQSKNMQVLSQVLEQIAESGLTRSDVLVTLGGGVVGDLGGFAAASFMRGIAFVQVPTSLLSQIDSSVGGKVAVDLKAGKNLAGAFYQPKGVFIDTNLLSTLPVRFLHDGLAEAIKYGCIQDANLFEKIAGYADDSELLADIDSVVATCCAIKARIVEEDEFDTGLRGILNFGHTLGHAVEQHYAYGEYTHGEGVAIGMYQIT